MAPADARSAFSLEERMAAPEWKRGLQLRDSQLDELRMQQQECVFTACVDATHCVGH